jgi:aspartate-semialdehyde dehydrogenase
MRELLTQMGTLNASVRALLDDPASAILEIDRQVAATQRGLPAEATQNFIVPLAGSLIPWIDADRGDGTSLEEWKGGAETNKILGRGPGFGSAATPIDSLCVRVGAMRCHSQALTIKLKKDVPLADLEAMIRNDNAWVRYVPNTKADSIQGLTPLAVCARWRSGRSTWARSPSETSCFGARRSRSVECCACCSRRDSNHRCQGVVHWQQRETRRRGPGI